MVDRMLAADMSERLAPGNAVPLEENVATVIVDDGVAVVVADCRSTASMDAHCKEAASSYNVAFDCIRHLTVALTQRSE